MRVLQVLGNLGYGGIETFLMNVYRHIDRDKIQFDFLVRSDNNGEKVQEIESMGGRVFFSPSFIRHPVANYIFVSKFFKNHAEEYDAVHVHCNSFIYPLPVALAHKHKIKTIILHSHNTCNHGKIISLYHKFNENKYDKYLTKRFACSEEAGKWMYVDKPFSVIHNGIDLDVFKIDNAKRIEYRKKLGFNDDDFVIGHVGRFCYQKNQEFLVEVLYKLLDESRKYKILFVGDGETKTEVVIKAKDMGISENVVFAGNVIDVQNNMQAMDIFALPSRYEGLPVVAVEAQACGLPCVFSSEITKEVKMTDNVEFVSLSNKDEWIDSIGKMIWTSKTYNAEKIQSAGYDIKEASKCLEKIYLGR